MHYLYLDESGDEGDYFNQSGVVKIGSSRWITVGGIVAGDSKIMDLHYAYDSIIDKYFIGKGITLKPNFKLHYSTLKHDKEPYDKLTFEDKCGLVRDVFNAVINTECHLISCSIDIARHCNRYDDRVRVNPKAYAILVAYERFVYFLEDFQVAGSVIYEEFNHIRKKMGAEFQRLLSYNAFPNPAKLQNFERYIVHGKPKQYPILQLADFIVNCVWFHAEQRNQINDRFPSLIPKYYNFSGTTFKRGYVEI